MSESIMKKISELFDVVAPPTAMIEVKPASAFTPVADFHIFDANQLKKVLMWWGPTTPLRNLMLMGGKGVGKTSLVQQFAARMGIEVFPISCSGKTRFADLVGTLIIDTDGSTRFVDGPLTRAFRNGGIFLGNEITRMDSGEQMRFVDVLDKNPRLTISQTGEVLTPHVNFRFAATGNSGGHGDESGAYAGEKVGSSAFMDRFIKLEMEGISLEDEKGLIAKIIGDSKFAETMVTFARECRKAYVGEGGGCRIDVSPRATILWAQVACEYKVMSGKHSLEEALSDVVLNGSPKDDREAVVKLFQKFFRMD